MQQPTPEQVQNRALKLIRSMEHYYDKASSLDPNKKPKWPMGDSKKDKETRKTLNMLYFIERGGKLEVPENPYYFMVNKQYKKALANIKTLEPENDMRLPKYTMIWDGFERARDLMPEELPQKAEEITFFPSDINIPLWEWYEEEEIGFDLGDDGTDEMQEDMDYLEEVLTAVKQGYFMNRQLGNELWNFYQIRRWIIDHELLNGETINSYFGLDYQNLYILLKEFTTDNLSIYDEQNKWLLNFIEEEVAL